MVALAIILAAGALSLAALSTQAAFQERFLIQGLGAFRCSW